MKNGFLFEEPVNYFFLQNICILIIQVKMADIEDYKKCLLEFYKKVISPHQKKLVLFEKFQKITKEFSSTSQARISRKLSSTRKGKTEAEESKSVSGLSSRSAAKSYRSVRNVPLKSISMPYLFLTDKFLSALAFGHLYALIEKQEQTVLSVLEEKVKLIVKSKQKNSEATKWERALIDWKRIHQLTSNKEKVRWQKLLGDAINSLPKQFILIILNLVFQNLPFAYFDEEPQVLIQKINEKTNSKIGYFQSQNGVIIKINAVEEYENNKIILGFLVSDGKFGCFDRIPQFSFKNKLAVEETMFSNQFTVAESSQNIEIFENNAEKESVKSGQNNIFHTEKKTVFSSQKCTPKKLKIVQKVESLMLMYKKNTKELLKLNSLIEKFEQNQKRPTIFEKKLKTMHYR